MLLEKFAGSANISGISARVRASETGNFVFSALSMISQSIREFGGRVK